MDPDAALERLRELLGGDHSSKEAPSLSESLRDHTEELEDTVCEAETLFQALDRWLSRKRGRLPKAWSTTPNAADIVNNLLFDIDQVLERQGEIWWDDTVVAGLHHRQQAEALLGRPLSAGIEESDVDDVAKPPPPLDSELCAQHLESVMHAADARDRKQSADALASFVAGIRRDPDRCEAVELALRCAATDDEDPGVRQASVRALGELGCPSSAETLRNIGENDHSRAVQAAAFDALQRYRTRHRSQIIEAAAELLRRTLPDPSRSSSHHPYRYLQKSTCTGCGADGPIAPQGDEPLCFDCLGYVVLDCGKHVLSKIAASCGGSHHVETRCAICEDGTAPTSPNHSH